MEESKKLITECDRLSNLPDDLLCHILSFLPTKVAYKTIVLSTRWRSLCTKIHDLHFQLPRSSNSKECKEVQFVTSILLRRTAKIRKLTLYSFFGCEPTDVYLWILKALNLKIEELLLNLTLNKPTLLPLQLPTCQSLVVLKLRGKIQPTFFNSYLDVNFPSLKILHLQLLVYNSILDNQDYREYDISDFLYGCPRLQEFRLYDCLKQPIDISFKLLKALYLNLFLPIFITEIDPLHINAPSLEVLHICDNSLRKYESINLVNVDRATLCINKYSDFESLYRLFKGISNVKSLTLTYHTIKFLSKEDNVDNLSLLNFRNLLYLSVQISENCNWNMLLSFLQNAPKLKNLVIQKRKIFERKEVEKSRWVEPQITPTCLSTNLRIFEFKGIQNIKAELDFTLYIIKSSSMLEKVKIFTPKSKRPEKTSFVERKLLKCSKKSSIQALEINSF